MKSIRRKTDSLGREHINFYVELLARIRRQSVRPANDPCCETMVHCPDDIACERDIVVIRRRARTQGIKFLTELLPLLGKAFDRALLGDRHAFENCPFKKDSSNLPILFGSLMHRVLDSNGCVRSDACPQAVRLIRQLTFLFYKLNVPYEPTKDEKVINEFIQTDQQLPSAFAFADTGFSDAAVERISTLPSQEVRYLSDSTRVCVDIARYIIATSIGSLDPRDIKPRHGPGSVATGESPSEKSEFDTLITRAEHVYPFMDYMRFSWSHVCDRVGDPLNEVDVGTAKVVLVPKDSRGPRLISCEPLNNQWLQQGQNSLLVEAIETGSLTKGQVNFSDQRVNGLLALQSSLSKEYATLDMKEASDRVSWGLLELLLPEHWLSALWATRSPRTLLPNGQIVELNKFAPMGSAVCFPVESLIFFALSVGSIYSKRIRLSEGSLAIEMPHLRIDRDLLRKICATTFVYGDDIIVPTEDSGTVLEYLPHFELKFNEAKCCRSGFFRESCGVDAFKGVNVTPTRLRESAMSSSIVTKSNLLPYTEFSNSLWVAGYRRAADYVSTIIIERYNIPTMFTPGEPTRIGGLALYRPYVGSPSLNKRRWNRKRQCCETKTYSVVPVTATGTSPGWEELLRSSSEKRFVYGRACSNQRKPGDYALPRRYKLKRGWVAIEMFQ